MNYTTLHIHFFVYIFPQVYVEAVNEHGVSQPSQVWLQFTKMFPIIRICARWTFLHFSVYIFTKDIKV